MSIASLDCFSKSDFFFCFMLAFAAAIINPIGNTSFNNDFNLTTNWYNDNNQKIEFFANIGINYNHAKLKELALIYEYSKYKLEHYRNDNKIINNYSFDDFKKIIEFKGNLMFIPFLSKFINSNNLISDLTIENTEFHSFIGGSGFAVSNCAMGKQALGFYASSHQIRTDTITYVLDYPQRPLVSTIPAQMMGFNDMPSGINAIVAIACYTGFKLVRPCYV